MPFLPAELLHRWTASVLSYPAAKLAFFIVDEVPQPALCLLHRDVLPFLSSAVAEGRHKLFPVLQQAANELAQQGGVAIEDTLLVRDWRQAKASALFEDFEPGEGTGGRAVLTPAQRAASNLWFENLNTPEQFAEAQRHLDALVDP
jgi:molybdopterin-guanine dinucleotide biosynthesis protein A